MIFCFSHKNHYHFRARLAIFYIKNLCHAKFLSGLAYWRKNSSVLARAIVADWKREQAFQMFLFQLVVDWWLWQVGEKQQFCAWRFRNKSHLSGWCEKSPVVVSTGRINFRLPFRPQDGEESAHPSPTSGLPNRLLAPCQTPFLRGWSEGKAGFPQAMIDLVKKRFSSILAPVNAPSPLHIQQEALSTLPKTRHNFTCSAHLQQCSVLSRLVSPVLFRKKQLVRGNKGRSENTLIPFSHPNANHHS